MSFSFISQLQMTQLQGLANVGLMAQLQTLTQQQQSMQQQAQSMQALQAMFSQKPIPNLPSPGSRPASRSENQLSSSRLMSNGHQSPESKFPLSREAISSPPPRKTSNSSLIRPQSSGTNHFDGFGAPIPANESVLKNAIRNKGNSRELAHNSVYLVYFFDLINLSSDFY